MEITETASGLQMIVTDERQSHLEETLNQE